ncbi:MAG TPA: type II toxin-antitoxin system VapC family toxin [Nocardioidaceae bacterium]|nr:type II toxin-antitoxin system VapC family toxin [Nocardioidaceae bacterium]
MRLLIDTHVVLWRASGERSISMAARTAIEEASELFVSVVSFAEIGGKVAIGKLAVAGDLRAHVLDGGARILPLEAEHGLAVGGLPMHHRDPFDRLLIAQARAERLAVVTADPRFGAYDVAVVDAA